MLHAALPTVIVASAGLVATFAWLHHLRHRRTPELKFKLTDVERTAVGVCCSRCSTSDFISALEGAAIWDPCFDQAIVNFVLSKRDETEWLDRFYLSRPVVGGGLEGSWEKMVAIRTVCIDQNVMGMVQQGVKQVVIIGAGLDCRAWRLPFPTGVKVWEVDSGSVEALKLRALQGMPLRARSRVFVKLDLDNQSQQLTQSLAASGLDASQKTLWIAEGLIGYLTVDAGNRLMKEMRANSASGSRLVMTCPPTEKERDAAKARGKPLFHVIFEEGLATSSRLEAAGWAVYHLTSEALAIEYNIPELRPQSILIASC